MDKLPVQSAEEGMRFLYIFPGSDKEGRAIGAEQRDDGKLLVSTASCIKDTAPDKAIGRAVCYARRGAGQYSVMSLEELAVYIGRMGSEPVTSEALKSRLGLP